MARRGEPGQNPTLRGRRLAMELQRRREATGMSREEVARQRPGPPGDGEDGRAGAQPGPRHDQRRQHLVTGCRRQQEVGREADGLPQGPT